jgi:glycosyltransferase involved in cell wall biosynthesis
MISLVINTRNRQTVLSSCISALSMVDADNWQLVIVDNGSTDGTAEYLAALPRRIGNAVVVIVYEPKKGSAVAKNAGWHSATGDIVAFIDDDCRVTPDFIRSVDQVFSESPEVGVIGGRILLHDPRDQRITILEDMERREYPAYSFIAAGAIQGANIAFRRRTLELIGGFDERLGAGTLFPCEDIDAVATALWRGIPAAYDPRPTVFHAHGRRAETQYQALMAYYDAGRGVYYIKRIIDPKSRSAYLRAWCNSIWREFQNAAKFATSGRIHTMGQSRREVVSAFRFAGSLLRRRIDRELRETNGGDD